MLAVLVTIHNSAVGGTRGKIWIFKTVSVHKNMLLHGHCELINYYEIIRVYYSVDFYIAVFNPENVYSWI